MSTETTTINELVDGMISGKSGPLLVTSDVPSKKAKVYPLIEGLIDFLDGPYWRPDGFNPQLLGDLKKETKQRLGRELLKVAIERSDLAYIAEVVVVHQQMTAEFTERDNVRKKTDFLDDLPSRLFPPENVSLLTSRFTTAERAKFLPKLFKLLAHKKVKILLGDQGRATFALGIYGSKHLPPQKKASEFKKDASNALFKKKEDFNCLLLDDSLFDQTAIALQTFDKPEELEEGARKLFIDWIRDSNNENLILDERVWSGLGLEQRLKAIGEGFEPELEEKFYQLFIRPELESPTAETVLRLALVKSKKQGRKAINLVPDGVLRELVSPANKKDDASVVLLKRTLALSGYLQSTELVGLRKELGDLNKELIKTRKSLEDEKTVVNQLKSEVDEAMDIRSKLEARVEFEETARRRALESELDVARFDAMKRLCAVHRNLQIAADLAGTSPEAYVDLADLTLADIRNMGVETIGERGQILPFEPSRHKAECAEGALVEIRQIGYIFTAWEKVILPALAIPAKQR